MCTRCRFSCYSSPTVQCPFWVHVLYVHTYTRYRQIGVPGILYTLCCSPPSSPSLFAHSDVAFFRHSLVRYRRQHNQALACPKLKDVGMILVDTNDLREDLLPNPMRCLKVRHTNVIASLRAYMCVYILYCFGSNR